MIGCGEARFDLRFPDEIHGHLFKQAEKTMDLLLSKYLEASILRRPFHIVNYHLFVQEPLGCAVSKNARFYTTLNFVTE